MSLANAKPNLLRPGQRIALFGAGGHAKVVAEAVEALGARVVGFVDERVAGQQQLGYPIVAHWRELPAFDGVLVAIGGNAVRLRLGKALQEEGLTLLAVVDPRAIVSPRAVVGPGSLVVAGAVVNADARLGEGVIVNTGATVDHDCVLEDGVHVAPGVHLAGGVHLEEGAFLGIGAVATPGVRVGPWATVGAGSVLTRSVAGGATYVGAPARLLRREEREGPVRPDL